MICVEYIIKEFISQRGELNNDSANKFSIEG